MTYCRKAREFTHCVKCSGEIPSSRRSDAKYCGVSCRDAAEKKRYKEKHPDYVERQKRLVNEWRHQNEHGHLEFIDNPLLNKKDRFALARSLGFRSMLEYTVAKQLTDAGVSFQYEKFKIKYIKEDLDWGEDEQETGSEKW